MIIPKWSDTYLSVRHLLTKAVEGLVLIVFVFISVSLLHVVLTLGILIRARNFLLYLSTTRRRRSMWLLLSKSRTLRKNGGRRWSWARLLDGRGGCDPDHLPLYIRSDCKSPWCDVKKGRQDERTFLRGSLHSGQDDWWCGDNWWGFGDSETEAVIHFLYRVAACWDKGGLARVITL
jgi:hypothetical protein